MNYIVRPCLIKGEGEKARKERRKRKEKLLALKTLSVKCEDILEKPRAKALFL